MKLERERSLLFDEYEHSVTKTHSQISLLRSLDKKPSTLDDSDMIPLTTEFDSQMNVGLPMPFEHLKDGYNSSSDNEDTLSIRSFTPVTKEIIRSDILWDYSINKSVSGKNKFILDKVTNLRKRNIILSYQDARRNLKNALNTVNHALDIKKYEEQSYKVSKRFTSQFFNLQSFKKNLLNDDIRPAVNHENFDNPSGTDTLLFKQFQKDYDFLLQFIRSSNFNIIAEKRLTYLLEKYKLYLNLHSKNEVGNLKMVPHKDFYNVKKIDNNLCLYGCISTRNLNDFIVQKLKTEPDRIVYVDSTTGEKLSLRDLFRLIHDQTGTDDSIHCNLKIINGDFLEWYKIGYLPNLHLIYNQPELEARVTGKEKFYFILTRTFLEFNNFIEGEYLALVLKENLIHPLEKSRYQLAQLSIDYQYFDNENWWLSFSQWLVKWKIFSRNVRWNVQISRIYTKLYGLKKVENFQDYLDSIFKPLCQLHEVPLEQQLAIEFLLTQVSSFDLVLTEFDETMWKSFSEMSTHPKDWSSKGDNPPIAYYMFYLFQAVKKINSVRFANKQSTFVMRSNCLQSSSIITSKFSNQFNCTEKVESLICNILLCNGGILNAENIWDSPFSILYLIYLFQVPCIVSPLSSTSSLINNPMRIPYEIESNLESLKIARRNIVLEKEPNYTQNPFMKLFQMGFRVSLSTDSVLFNRSFTSEPLIEEYSVAANIYLLNSAELAELCRNSVLSCGFEGWYKREWSGCTVFPTLYVNETVGGIDLWYDVMFDTVLKHNVPLIRRKYRNDTLALEREFLNYINI